MSQTFKDWAISKHVATNHFYNGDLPYSFHLDIVAKEVKHWLPVCYPDMLHGVSMQYIDVAYGHDLIEDTRTSYNDVLKQSNKWIADAIYALTNEKGRNRLERASKAYYDGITATDGAPFIKVCDRIANVKFGILTSSHMVNRYEVENPHFVAALAYDRIKPMIDYLDHLFKLRL